MAITSVSMVPKGFTIITTPSTTLSTGSSRKPFQLRILAAAQLQGVLDAAKAVEDDEQAEHDGQDADHDVAAQDAGTRPAPDRRGRRSG